MGKRGLFVGLLTLDLIYLADGPPAKNQKIVAADYTIAAGGPATNAAVTFSHLGNQARLLGVLGQHPMTQLIRADLQEYQVILEDLSPTCTRLPPVSSIVITQKTGERAVISLNALKTQAIAAQIPENILKDIDIVLIDGHQTLVGAEIAKAARSSGIPVVLDGGSWKPGLETILPFVNYAICSSNFYPPGSSRSESVLEYLSAIEVPQIAITNGEKPIQYANSTQVGWLEVPQVNPVDTLGAGDIFHGAFSHFILEQEFAVALAEAAKIAAYSCQFLGTRRWLQQN
jgi:sugar/nucleoside kinase (ribokinase family)